MENQAISLEPINWVCEYHVVFCPKHSRKIIYTEYRRDLQEIIRTLCMRKDVELIKGDVMPDHVHLLLSIPPKMSVSSFMAYLKGESALMIFAKYADLKDKFENRSLWAEGYYVSTEDLNEAAIEQYIQDQEKYSDG